MRDFQYDKTYTPGRIIEEGRTRFKLMHTIGSFIHLKTKKYQNTQKRKKERKKKEEALTHNKK